ncbi:MAG: histidinol-phosphate transaminase [Verrucomicrobiota bacterium JB022]|nr:histidinol-phosphate transaminase [Verrucomicrobiota bacterium JB022]
MLTHFHSVNRLPLFRTGSLLALLALGASPLRAQHEISDDAEQAPVMINYNENAFGYSQMAQMAIMQKLQGANRYAAAESQELQQTLAADEKVKTDHLLVTAGSGAVLTMTGLAYGEPGKNVITTQPGYTDLTDAFVSAGGEAKYVPLNDKLQYDLAAIKQAIDADTKVVYICNPNNPTGTIVNPLELTQFILSAPKDVLIFIDEAYLDLAPGGLEKNSMVKLVSQRPNLIVARTFSKVYGMAGLRIGYGVAQPQTLEKLRPYFQGGPSILSAVAATAAVQDTDFYNYSVESYTQVREMVKKRLDEMGIEYADPNGSFIFIHTGVPIQELNAKLEEQNVIIGRPFPPLLDWARVTLGTPEEMEIFLEAFERAMKDLGKLAA